MAGAILIMLFGGVMALVTRTAFGSYPLAVFIAMAVIGVIILICLCTGKMATNPLVLPNRYELLFIATLIACLPLMKLLGFYTAGACALLGLTLLTNRDLSPKGLLHTIVYVICVTVGVYLVFTQLLKIPTPIGLFL